MSEHGHRMASMIAKAWRKTDFDKIDRAWLAKLSDKELASWQADHPADSPQFLLAQFEWSRRLTESQIRASLYSARWQAWFGLAAAAVGSLLTLIGVWLTK